MMDWNAPIHPSDAAILAATTAFRRVIDLAGQEAWKRKYITFPRGPCGHAAELLTFYLRQRFGIVPDYISRTTYEIGVGGWTGGHAWLEWIGLTIDVSGDQFGWPPVIVTREPLFYGQVITSNALRRRPVRSGGRSNAEAYHSDAPHLDAPALTTGRT